MIKKIQSKEGDTGSTDVQSKNAHIRLITWLSCLISVADIVVGVLTVRVNALHQHLLLNKKDVHSK